MAKVITLAEAVRLTLEALGLRKRSYFLVFRSPAGIEVLRDLAKFCRATEPVWGSTDRDTARLVGRNEVWCRIMQHLNLSAEELYELYGGKYPLQPVEEDENA